VSRALALPRWSEREGCCPRIEELLEEAGKRLSFMEVMVPLHRRPMLPHRKAEGGKETFVCRDGEILDGTARAKQDKAKYTNWREGNMDPHSVARHNHLMRRFRFEDRPGGPPSGPVWS